MKLSDFAKNKAFVKEFVRWAWPCMKNLHLYSKKKQAKLKGVWPTIEKKVFSAAKTGEIDTEILTYWDTALKGVLKLETAHPMLDYMFGEHNKKVKKLAQFSDEMWRCSARVGIFDGRKVVFPNGKSEVSEVASYLKIKKGDKVGVHLNTVVDVLDKPSFYRCVGEMKKQGLL